MRAGGVFSCVIRQAFRVRSGPSTATLGARALISATIFAASLAVVPAGAFEIMDIEPAIEMFFRRIALSEKINLSNYVLSEDDEFMNANQRAYFRAKLVAWRNDILREARETLGHLAEESANHPDLADRASSETDRAIELRARDRQRKLISKIDAAMQRIDEGTYGYCEETGEPIGLKRLDARPIATLSIEAQERHERREKVYRDD
eukprot:gene7226-9750_t